MYAETNKLLTSTLAYRSMANAINPYGDGQAAQRTVHAIEHMFGLSARPAPFEPGTAAAQVDERHLRAG